MKRSNRESGRARINASENRAETIRVCISMVVCLIVSISLTGCITYQKSDDRIFADCDSFLAYYDSCARFMESPGERCLSYETLDIPKDDKECYPIVECDRFMKSQATTDRLVDCRYEPTEPKCILSFDISCESFNVTDGKLSMVIKNNMEEHVRDVSLSVVADNVHMYCADSDSDGFLSFGEQDIFTCEGTVQAGELILVYRDYYSEAMSTKTGMIITG